MKNSSGNTQFATTISDLLKEKEAIIQENKSGKCKCGCHKPGSTMTGNGDDIKDLRKFHFKLKGAKNNV